MQAKPVPGFRSGQVRRFVLKLTAGCDMGYHSWLQILYYAKTGPSDQQYYRFSFSKRRGQTVNERRDERVSNGLQNGHDSGVGRPGISIVRVDTNTKRVCPCWHILSLFAHSLDSTDVFSHMTSFGQPRLKAVTIKRFRTRVRKRTAGAYESLPLRPAGQRREGFLD